MATTREAEVREKVEALFNEASALDDELREMGHPEWAGLNGTLHLVYGICATFRTQLSTFRRHEEAEMAIFEEAVPLHLQHGYALLELVKTKMQQTPAAN